MPVAQFDNPRQFLSAAHRRSLSNDNVHLFVPAKCIMRRYSANCCCGFLWNVTVFYAHARWNEIGQNIRDRPSFSFHPSIFRSFVPGKCGECRWHADDHPDCRHTKPIANRPLASSRMYKPCPELWKIYFHISIIYFCPLLKAKHTHWTTRVPNKT